MNNPIINTFKIYDLVRLPIAIATRPIQVPNPKSSAHIQLLLKLIAPKNIKTTDTAIKIPTSILHTFLRESNTLFSFLHHFKNYSSIPLDTVSIVSRNSFTCDIGNRVKESFMTCGAVISNCIRCCVFRNPDHNPQVILFEVLI